MYCTYKGMYVVVRDARRTVFEFKPHRIKNTTLCERASPFIKYSISTTEIDLGLHPQFVGICPV